MGCVTNTYGARHEPTKRITGRHTLAPRASGGKGRRFKSDPRNQRRRGLARVLADPFVVSVTGGSAAPESSARPPGAGIWSAVRAISRQAVKGYR